MASKDELRLKRSTLARKAVDLGRGLARTDDLARACYALLALTDAPPLMTPPAARIDSVHERAYGWLAECLQQAGDREGVAEVCEKGLAVIDPRRLEASRLDELLSWARSSDDQPERPGPGATLTLAELRSCSWRGVALEVNAAEEEARRAAATLHLPRSMAAPAPLG